MRGISDGILVGLFVATAFTIDHYIIHGAKKPPLSHLPLDFWLGVIGGLAVGRFIVEPIISPYLKR